MWNMYVVYDRVAEESGPIFEAKNDGTAARAARDPWQALRALRHMSFSF